MTFQPNDRVTVPSVGALPRLPASVVMVFTANGKPYGVLCKVDGDSLMHGYKLHEVQPFTAHDTRPADSVAEMCYYPSECVVCEGPTMQGSIYCSDAHRKIQEGEPDAREIAANL